MDGIKQISSPSGREENEDKAGAMESRRKGLARGQAGGLDPTNTQPLYY